MLVTAAPPRKPRTDKDALALAREFYEDAKHEGYSRDDMVAEMLHAAAKGMAVAFHQLRDPLLAATCSAFPGSITNAEHRAGVAQQGHVHGLQR